MLIIGSHHTLICYVLGSKCPFHSYISLALSLFLCHRFGEAIRLTAQHWDGQWMEQHSQRNSNNTVAVTRELMWKSNINEEQRRKWMPKETEWKFGKWNDERNKGAHHQFQCGVYCHRKWIELIVKWYCNIKTTTMTIVGDTSANKCNRFFSLCVLFLLEFIAVVCVCVYRSVWTWEYRGNNL